MTVQQSITRIRQLVAVQVDDGWVLAERIWTTATTTVQGEVQATDQPPAIEMGNAYQAPPTYNSAEMGSSEESDSRCSKKVWICCGGCLISVWTVVSLYMIIIGIIADKCPVEDNIDRYLIVQGILNLLYLISCGCSGCACSHDKNSCLAISLCCGCNTVFVCLIVAWTVFGSILVWRSLDEWLHDHSVCDSALFISAMVCVLLHYMILSILTCCCFCCCCIKLCFSTS